MKKKTGVLIILTALLTACEKGIPLEFKQYEYLNEASNTISVVNKLTIEDKPGVVIKTGVKEYSNLNDVNQGFDQNNRVLLSNNIDPTQIIEQKILVVPVYFTDSSVASNEQLKEDKKVLIENAFFGDSGYTTYQSVSSYYNKSSYGHLRLSGEVLDWMAINTSGASAAASSKSKPEDYTDSVARQIAESLSEDKFNEYSKNKEGILDSLFIVYDYPYQKEHSDTTLLWAFSSHCQNSDKVSAYAWTSFDFLGTDVLDTHLVDSTTYIHETGHLLGLLDYYNDRSGVSYQPTGFMDMMDYNLGDHSPISKFLLNWTSPTVLDMGESNEKSITLKSFSETGEFILIPRGSYNGTAFDKYLLVSYFTPTGLNDMSNYPSYVYLDKNNNQQAFTYPNKRGVMMHEIDARLAYYKADVIRNIIPTCTVDETPDAGNYVINFYRDNQITNDKDVPFVHLLESSGLNTFKEGLCASNDTLFKFGSTFGIDTFEELSNECGVSFKISKLSLNEVTITFNKK